MYSLQKITVQNRFKCSIYGNGKHDVTLIVEPKINERTLNQNDISDNNSLTKQFYEILIRDILHSNPYLDFYKGLFVHNPNKFKNQGKVDPKNLIGDDKYKVEFYPGYTTSLMYTEGGKFLNVTLKSKILETKTIYDLIKNDYKKKINHHKIRDLIGKKFQVTYAKRNYMIYDISFDRNPGNLEFLFNKKRIKLSDYYSQVYGIKIKDLNQPLLIVKGNLPQEKEKDMYFVPEL